MRISRGSLLKALRKLRDAGWVESTDGVNGGYRLTGKASELLSLLDIMCVTEDTMKLNRCLEDDGYCSRNATTKCAVHELYAGCQAQLEGYFNSVKLSMLP